MNKMKKMDAELIIWDLDGTLIDSKRDIAYAVNTTLARIDHPPLSNELIYEYVGNGVRPLIEKAVLATGGGNSLETAISHFQEIYLAHLLDTTVLFEGIAGVLEHFKGKKMAVASNKPYRYVEKILEGLGVARYFVSVKGGDSVPEKKPHPLMLEEIMREAGAAPAEAVFIGDSAVDMQTGKNANVRTVGVIYGFRPESEIRESAPDIIVAAPHELKGVIA
ncbi:MAG: HAD-IA family hydrolase [Nitrospinae bacterium]|nr:HAD-IA family hydrolase [Nitrospinota bacterium]